MRRLVAVDGLSVGRGGDPSGPPVVFVHGAMDRGAAFLRVTRLLPDTDWLVYDRRGYGRSIVAEGVAFDVHVSDLVELLSSVRAERGRPAVVVGHSLGGTIALAAAWHRPELVASVAVYEAPLTWEPWWPRRRDGATPLEDQPGPVAAEQFMRAVAGDAVWEALPGPTRQRRLEEGSALVAELASVRERPAFVPSEIAVPVTVARGSHTDEHRERAAEVLVREVPGAELVLLDHADHGAHTSRPQEFAALVRRALERSGGPGPHTL